MSDSQAAVAVEEKDTDASQASTLNTPEVHNVGDGENAQPEKPVQEMDQDQYPHGMKLVLLAGSSLVAVFLIALDQVSSLQSPIPIPYRLV
jgi:hypothetical protein